MPRSSQTKLKSIKQNVNLHIYDNAEENQHNFIKPRASIAGPVTRHQQSLRENQELELNCNYKNGKIPNASLDYESNIRVLRSSSKISNWSISKDEDTVIKFKSVEIGLTSPLMASDKTLVEDEISTAENTIKWINNLPAAKASVCKDLLYIKSSSPSLRPSSPTCNGFLKHRTSDKIELKNDNNPYHYSCPPAVLQVFLYLYVFFSWNFLKCFNSIMAESLLKHYPSPSSFEEYLAFKIVWCIIFGVMTDFTSWKISFYCQSIIWVLLLGSIHCDLLPDIISVVLLFTCLSSSNVVVFYIGIVNILGPSNSLHHIARMSAFSSFLPMMFNSVFPRILGYTISKELILSGCAISLFMSTLAKETPLQNSSFSCFTTSPWKKIVDFILLKFCIIVPALLTLAFYNNNEVATQKASLVILSTTSVIQIIFVPIIYFCTTVKILLVMSSTLLCFLYLIMGSVVSWAGAPVILIPLCGILCLFHSFFEVSIISQFRKNTGFIISILVTSQFIMCYICDAIYSKVSDTGPYEFLISNFNGIKNVVNHFCTNLPLLPSFMKIDVIKDLAIRESQLDHAQSSIVSIFQNLFYVYNSSEQNEILFVSYIGSIFSVFALLMVIRLW